MADKMLIDASHKEETRVVVTRGNRIEEFDFESEHKKQLKGNIYLARVTRVEPSLQAAFVEYGGNRHGFLAFSEIHPDYYQIPVADRQALIEAEAQAVKLENEREAREDDRRQRSSRRGKKASPQASDTDVITSEEEADALSSTESDDEGGSEGEENIEIVGAEDALEEVAHYAHSYRRDYKIQEVIKRRQILLVQVVKEERGNKGAALTTYLSLAGRYSVLMPNTARGGGISRKITNISDRKRLKEVVSDLEVPKGMGIILRTAGANRSKAEIRRDYEYLMRLWENVRNLTLTSIAPALVYEEGSLIKRSIRDLYNKDIGEVMVAGEEGYREAKDFMRMLMPSHAKVVQPYRDAMPIFARNGIEAQLDRMLQPEVNLKSGGYLVINQTEALVAIDVNSGRSTKEHSVEDTALQTNLEAAEEIARQLRLRDLAGLVVIDFIDMEERRHIRSVEKKLKDCLKDDRARIQVGHISHFGLLEMSRQRLRASVLESTTQICPHCHGTGYVRSPSSLALHVIRSIEEYLLRNRGHNITVRTSTQTALYVLNYKRQMLVDFEARFGLAITLEADEQLGTQHLAIDKGDVSTRTPIIVELPPIIEIEEEEEELIAIEVESDLDEEQVEPPTNGNGNGRRRRNKKRGRDREVNAGEARAEAASAATRRDDDTDAREERVRLQKSRRRQGKRGRNYDGRARLPWPEPVGAFAASAQARARHLRRIRYAPHAEPVGDFFTYKPEEEAILAQAVTAVDIPAAEIVFSQPDSAAVLEVAAPVRKRTRRNARATKAAATEIVAIEPQPVEAAAAIVTAPADEPQTAEPVKKPRGRPRKKVVAENADAEGVALADTPPVAAKPKRRRTTKAVESEVETVIAVQAVNEKNGGDAPSHPVEGNIAVPPPEAEPIIVSSSLPPAAEKPKRVGWWQRKGFF